MNQAMKRFNEQFPADMHNVRAGNKTQDSSLLPFYRWKNQVTEQQWFTQGHTGYL